MPLLSLTHREVVNSIVLKGAADDISDMFLEWHTVLFSALVLKCWFMWGNQYSSSMKLVVRNMPWSFHVLHQPLDLREWKRPIYFLLGTAVYTRLKVGQVKQSIFWIQEVVYLPTAMMWRDAMATSNTGSCTGSSWKSFSVRHAEILTGTSPSKVISFSASRKGRRGRASLTALLLPLQYFWIKLKLYSLAVQPIIRHGRTPSPYVDINVKRTWWSVWI